MGLSPVFSRLLQTTDTYPVPTLMLSALINIVCLATIALYEAARFFGHKIREMRNFPQRNVSNEVNSTRIVHC